MFRRLIALAAVCVVWTGCGGEAQQAARNDQDVAAEAQNTPAAEPRASREAPRSGPADPAATPEPTAPAEAFDAFESSGSEPMSEAPTADAPAGHFASGSEGGAMGGIGGDAPSPPAPSRYAAKEPAAAIVDALERSESRADIVPETTAEPMPATKREARDGEARRNRIQSGTLTAGSFDDHERIADYQEFVGEAFGSDSGEVLPRVERGRRVLIRVVNAADKPVGNARVVVRSAQGDDTVLDAVTASDGRTFFMAGPGEQGEFQVKVTPPDDAEPVTVNVAANQSPWRITLPQTASELPTQLDLALVIDCTGSMSDELEYLKVEIDAIAESIHQMFPNVDQRYALIVYRDTGDEYVYRTFDFTGSLSEFRTNLAAQRANGGGDYPEAMHVALEEATGLSWREENTARVLFLVGDAPPHDKFLRQTVDAVEVLRDCCVRVYPVASSGVRTKAEFIMRAASFMTMGKYLFLTDHSGVGNPHAAPHVPEYQVERLDRLMIRMIASELAGRLLEADQVIAIEQGDVRITEPEAVEPEPQGSAGPEEEAIQFSPPFNWASLIPIGQLPGWAWLVAAAAVLFGFDAVADRRR